VSWLERTRLALAALLLGSTVAHATVVQGGAQDPPRAFEAGIEAYRAGDLTSARQLWEGLLGEGAGLDREARTQVAYDLGNLAFREGRFLEAVARYEGVVDRAPRSADAWHNLELARARAGLEAADRGDLAATVERLLAAPTGRELELGTWLVLALLGLALAWEVRRGGLLPKLAAGGGLALVLGLLALGAWRAAGELERPVRVVASAGVDLRSEPDATLAALEHAPPGTELELLERFAGWAQVRRGTLTGWVPGEAVLEPLGWTGRAEP
jgi:tetratricopeptide (TPR) repeat protein